MAVDLIRDGIDVAVRVGNPPDSSHIMRRLRPVTEIVIGSPTHHARWCDVSDPAELAGAPWLIHAIAQPPTLVLRHAQSDAEHTLRRQPTVSVDDSHLLINGVMAGLGIAIVPDVIAAHALRDGTTHRILPNWHARQVWLYTLEASRSSLPRRRAFIDALRVHLQGLDSIR
jgi:DNA-binding transcriptional LysR family regulator